MLIYTMTTRMTTVFVDWHGENAPLVPCLISAIRAIDLTHQITTTSLYPPHPPQVLSPSPPPPAPFQQQHVSFVLGPSYSTSDLNIPPPPSLSYLASRTAFQPYPDRIMTLDMKETYLSSDPRTPFPGLFAEAGSVQRSTRRRGSQQYPLRSYPATCAT